jgi:class 3 adenylate cyclase/tetratricopeptide (TPR) repeat protein
MLCPQCRAENSPSRRFCAACGASFAVRCDACGFENESGAKFCGGCGRSVLASSTDRARLMGGGAASAPPPYLATKILQSREALEGERKQVTVLFADLKGSMELLAGRDPEDARALLDPVLKTMIDAVHRYEGTVNQVMGDGIMALFGAPIAHEDHAVRAGYAAIKMQESIRALATQVQQRHNVALQIRVGLNAGEVVVRGIGNDLMMDYTAVGETTHLAGRMEQLASPGAILVTEAFARLTEGYLHFKPLGLVGVKGLAEPMEIFELVDAEPTRGRFQAAARGLTRFVGRRAEIDAMDAALERARAGQGQVLAVIGEPGVGKSRLFYEFIDSPRSRGCMVLETGAVSYGKLNAYLPFRELLRTVFQIEQHDDIADVREKVVDGLTRLDESLLPTLPALMALLDVPVDDQAWRELDPTHRRQQMIDGLKRLLIRLSQTQPLILMVENLHWIDAETQRVLDTLVDSLPTARLLLLVNYRPEYHHAWGSKTYYVQLRLDPLSAQSATELLDMILGPAGDLQALKALLIERTEGNPFFLEECIRTLVETKVLLGERGACRLGKSPTAIRVPATVQAILAARIDRLSPDDKRILQTAAVIGKDVAFPLLQAVVAVPEADLRQRLAQLQTAEFLYETSLFPELEYTFKHALTQEVAYATLLLERRRELHARTVQTIETLYAARLANEVDRLAHHAFRGGMWEKAVGYFRQAGTKAAMSSAYREAVACFEQALAALKHLPESAATREQAFDLRMELRPWYAPLGDYDRVLENLREAEALAEALGDHRRLALICAYMTDYYRLTGASEQAIASGERALALATELDDFRLTVLANMGLGHACHAVGDYRRAVALLKRNVDALTGELTDKRFGAAGLPAVLSRSFMVFSLTDLGEFREATVVAEEAIQIAEKADTAHSQVLAAHSLALVYLCRGDLDRAVPLLEQTLHRCEVAHIPLSSRLLASTLGYAYALSGRVAEGAPLLEQSVRQAEALKVVFRYALWLTWLGEAYVLGGRLDDALALAQRAANLAEAHHERGHLAYALRLLGEIAAQNVRADIEHAAAPFRRSLALAEALDMRPLQAHCHLGLGHLSQRAGLPVASRAQLSAAVALYRSMEMRFWVARAEALMARG